MKYLLDVNMPVAWGWADHADHQRAAAWIASQMGLTSAIPQLGFVRVSVQRAGGQITAAEAGVVLQGMWASLGKQHAFLSDDMDSISWPVWCRGANRTTDAHLLALAKRHGAELATPDQGIPDALLVS
ncbi:MAG: hypothetical protein ACO1TE_26995 [Prosthecobacter sp.]